MTAYDKPDVWLTDAYTHTITVDPYRNAPWIHDGVDDKRRAAIERDRGYDAEDVKHIRDILQKQTPQSMTTFVPAWGDISGFSRYHGCGRERDDGEHFGEMPVVRKLLDGNALPDKAADVIEREIVTARHRQQTRIHDRSGQPDHGLPS